MGNGLTDLLTQGIAAAKAGDSELARDMLMRVVEQDETNIKAWLWLSQVVTDPDDRHVCLENVLALDPNNPIARRGLELLDRQQAAAPTHIRPREAAAYYPPGKGMPTMASAILHGQPDSDEAETQEPAGYEPPSLEESYASSSAPSPTMAAALLRPSQPTPQDEANAAPLYMSPILGPSNYPPGAAGGDEDSAEAGYEHSQAIMSEFDDVYMCPYCAELTQPDDEACPACQGALWQTVRRLPQRSSLLWITISLLVMGSLWSMLGLLVWGFVALQPLFTAEKVTMEQFVGLYLGLNTLPVQTATDFLTRLPRLTFWSATIGSAISLGLVALVYLRWRPIYWLLVTIVGANCLYTLAEAIFNTNLWSIGRAVISFSAGATLLLLQDDFALDRKRILCELDKNISSHSGFYMHGRDYARLKMWALATLHFKYAVGNAPTMIAYHLALAGAYAKLKRYQRAQSVLNEAARLDPTHPKVQQLSQRMAELIQRQAMAEDPYAETNQHEEQA